MMRSPIAAQLLFIQRIGGRLPPPFFLPLHAIIVS
jgi:hypothetical protein